MRLLLVMLYLGLVTTTTYADERVDADAAAPATPTAETLSEPGALAEYVTKSLRTKGRCVLPIGIIKTDKTIDLYRVLGGVIEGVGMAAGSSSHPDGFRTVEATTQAHTTIVGPNPVFRLRACQGLSIEHLTIESDRKGESDGGDADEGVGISYEHVPGWPCNYLTLHKVAFGTPIGFKAGEKSGDHNAADVTFSDCYFTDCKIGLEVNHNQGMNYRLTGCNFLMVETAVLLNRGGMVHLLDCFGFVEQWLVIKGGGPNLMPCRITNLNSDREPQHRPPVIVDASESTDQVRVIVDGVKVTQQGLHDRLHYSGHVYYRLPKNHKRSKSAIRVRDNDLNNYPWGGVYEPQVVE